jgi:hypothetical protein
MSFAAEEEKAIAGGHEELLACGADPSGAMLTVTRISRVADRRYNLRPTQPPLQKMFRLAAETNTLAACAPQNWRSS